MVNQQAVSNLQEQVKETIAAVVGLAGGLLVIGMLTSVVRSAVKGISEPALLPAVIAIPRMPEELKEAAPWISADFMEYVRDYMRLSRRPVSEAWVLSQWETWKRQYPKWRRSPLEKSELLPATIPRDDLKRIADKYGWWAAKLAEAICPHNDVACVEREAKRLHEARMARGA